MRISELRAGLLLAALLPLSAAGDTEFLYQVPESGVMAQAELSYGSGNVAFRSGSSQQPRFGQARTIFTYGWSQNLAIGAELSGVARRLEDSGGGSTRDSGLTDPSLLVQLRFPGEEETWRFTFAPSLSLGARTMDSATGHSNGYSGGHALEFSLGFDRPLSDGLSGGINITLWYPFDRKTRDPSGNEIYTVDGGASQSLSPFIEASRGDWVLGFTPELRYLQTGTTRPVNGPTSVWGGQFVLGPYAYARLGLGRVFN